MIWTLDIPKSKMAGVQFNRATSLAYTITLQLFTLA